MEENNLALHNITHSMNRRQHQEVEIKKLISTPSSLSLLRIPG